MTLIEHSTRRIIEKVYDDLRARGYDADEARQRAAEAGERHERSLRVEFYGNDEEW